MKKLNPGKFQITLGGKDQDILISLGLKTELYKLITRAQIKLAGLHKQLYMDEDIARQIQELQEQKEKLNAAEDSEEKLLAVAEKLQALHEEALRDLETRQNVALNAVASQQIEITEEVFAEAISCLLSPRNERGVVTEPVSTEEIMWSQKYSEGQEELMELLIAVTDYITSALKKISKISQMVQSTNEAAN